MQLFFKVMIIAVAAIAVLNVLFWWIKKGKEFYKKDDTVKAAAQPVEEPAIEEQKEETAQPVEETTEEEVVAAQEELVIGDAEEEKPQTKTFDFGNENAKRRSFAEKMVALPKGTKDYYTIIDNELRSYKKVSARVSSLCESFRVGRKLIAKIVVRGRTLTFYLALDVNAFKNTVYYQKDSSAVKAYAEVPFTVKVKSTRGLTNALKLVTALAEKEGLVKNPRYQKVNSVKLLKEKIS